MKLSHNMQNALVSFHILKEINFHIMGWNNPNCYVDKLQNRSYKALSRKVLHISVPKKQGAKISAPKSLIPFTAVGTKVEEEQMTRSST